MVQHLFDDVEPKQTLILSHFSLKKFKVQHKSLTFTYFKAEVSVKLYLLYIIKIYIKGEKDVEPVPSHKKR